MTCIVGLVDNRRVYIGGDSAGVGDWELTVRADEKVFKNGPMVMGFTSSFRMGQLLRYSLIVPARDPGMEIERYMVVHFVNAVRQCLKDGGYAKKVNEEETAGTFLVGYQGRLFKVCDDYQVEASRYPYMAVGSGGQIAMGALYATEGLPAEQRIITALSSAERFNAAVRMPFVVEWLEPEGNQPIDNTSGSGKMELRA